MKKRIGSLLIASALCLGLLSTAALADETTVPCVDGQHKETYGEPNCTSAASRFGRRFRGITAVWADITPR